MGTQVGEQLSTLNQGDLVTVTAAETHYRGEVVGVNRQQCDLVAGFMEDGYIGVQLRVDNESLNRNDLATEYLLVSATEEVPRSWSQATMSIYDPVEDTAIEALGAVSEIETHTD
ncbi:hypothetical protein [Halorubrum sp. BV1]|uniref:hypothetical protein n=1 Tax=Halorubrum sp. BV1 TaxID=1498500 RepID=UPI000678FF08|nr:hypothetical protein [Halorubrum sp. BV1]